MCMMSPNAIQLTFGATSGMEDSASNRRALESFVTGNRDLAELEALVSRFNIFEALGALLCQR